MFQHVHDFYRLAKRAQMHPLTRESRVDALARFVRWQAASRSIGAPIILPFISGTRLVVPNYVPGSPGNYYFGMIEFEEMSFVMHYLRPSDLFGDVGANIGSWTVAAAGVCGARVIALEPSPGSHEALLDNIWLNRIVHLVQPMAIGAGSERQTLRLSQNRGVENRIVDDGSGLGVDIHALDDVFPETPDILKIDVEGFEPNVVMGAKRLIGDERLKIVIIEDIGLPRGHDLDEHFVHRTMLDAGFDTYVYDVRNRIIERTPRRQDGNSIYLRNAACVQERAKAGNSFTVLGKTF